MPALLWIQHETGEKDENPCAELPEALESYRATDWKTKLATWEASDVEDPAEVRPELGLSDDTGRVFRLVPHSEELISASFWYPNLTSRFGLSPVDEIAFIGSLRIPREKTEFLITSFFRSDYEGIQKLILEYLDEEANRTDTEVKSVDD